MNIKQKRNFLSRGVMLGLLTLLATLLVLVACGDTPTPTTPPIPTSTVLISTLPIAPTPNGSSNQPTVTLNLNGPTAASNTATVAIFGTTDSSTPTDQVTFTQASAVTTIVATSGQPTDTPSGSAQTTSLSPNTAPTVNPTDNGNPTVTPTAIVPTQNGQPPTPPVGISPNPPPTPPVGISPAVINNTVSIAEQHFTLDLGGYQADASLEYPRSQAGPYPTILMFQPYGLYDLDATVTTSRFGIGSRNYKVLADQLAMRGFAVVRYTKRGYDTSGQNQFPTTDTPINQLISDANTAFTQVKANSLVDPRKLLLLGEDEGASVAMHVAQQQGNSVAGLILIAPITDPLAAWHYQSVDAPITYAHQSLDRNKDGLLSVQEWSNAPSGTFLASFQNVALDGDKITSMISTANGQVADIDHELKPFLEKKFTDGPSSYPDRAVYLTTLFKLGDNSATLTNYKKPVLLLQGALDQQVPLSQPADLDKFLTEQGNTNHVLIQYPKLGHSLYKLDRGGSDVLGPIDVNLEPPNNPLDDMLGWLAQYFS